VGVEGHKLGEMEMTRTLDYTTQEQVRLSFWEDNPLALSRTVEREIRQGRPDKDFRTDTRCAFVDYVDMLARDGRISEALASRVTLA